MFGRQQLAVEARLVVVCGLAWDFIPYENNVPVARFMSYRSAVGPLPHSMCSHVTRFLKLSASEMIPLEAL